MHTPTFSTGDHRSEERLKELILYVAIRCEHDPAFGATKLNKILWRSDFMAFAQLGEPITGVEYQRLPQGPAPRRLLPVQEELASAQRAVVSTRPGLGGYPRKVTIPLEAPNLSLFSGEQIAIVDEVIEEYRDLTATEVSDLSHGKAWEIIPNRESIPYETVFVADRVTQADHIQARVLCEEHGLE